MPIAILFMFVALALITPTLMHGIQQDNQLIMGTVAAKQLHQVTEAAKGYITAYAGAIEGSATATTPATITVSMLVNTGFLPQGFQAGNPYGQTWEVQVLQPQPGNLQALVLSQGGTPIQPADAPRIASEAGAEGGTINAANNTAQGSYGGWSVSMHGYANPGAGHLAALVAYSNGQLQSDYLYRVAVPGQPQLNQMQTNLDMGNNNLNNANEVNAQSETLAAGDPNGQYGALQIGSNYYYGDGSNAAVRTPGGFYVQNQNGSGPADIAEVNNVQSFGRIGAAGEPATGGYPSGWYGGVHTWDMYANGTVGTGENGSVNAYMNDFNGGIGNGGQVVTSSPSGNTYAYMQANNGGASVVTNGNINTPGFYANNNGYSGTTDTFTAGSRVILGTAFGSANVGWGCSPNGEIAANANGSGQVLACQGGTWQAMGGQPFFTYDQSVTGYGGGVVYNIGWYKLCVFGYGDGGGAGGNQSLYPVTQPNANGQ
ncbi:MAG: shufflon system plasmid conjugative transfer pilus tip adhesin PilV, partial [Sulfuriferula sp.]